VQLRKITATITPFNVMVTDIGIGYQWQACLRLTKPISE